MEDKEKRSKEQGEFRKMGGAVTRVEFYACFLVLMVSLAWRSGIASRTMEEHMTAEDGRAERMMEMIQDSQSEILRKVGQVPYEVEREANSLWTLNSLWVTGANHKTKTLQVEFRANLKEYEEGMEAEVVFLHHGGELASVPGVVGKDRKLYAKAEIPFCEWFSAEVRLQNGGVEASQGADGLEVTEDMTTPVLKGTWKEFSHKTKDGKDSLEGVMKVTAEFPGAWEAGEVPLPLQSYMLEIQRDGVPIHTVPMEAEWDGRRTACFYGRIPEAITLEEGRKHAFLFKAEDVDGARYTYFIEEGTLNAKTGRYDTSRSWVDDDINGGNLVIE